MAKQEMVEVYRPMYEAMVELLNWYENGIKLSNGGDCVLCIAMRPIRKKVDPTSGDCNGCAWTIFANCWCMDKFKNGLALRSIGQLRDHPERYSFEKKIRIAQLKDWIQRSVIVEL